MIDNSEGKAILKDHIKYYIKNLHNMTVEKSIFETENKKIINISVNVEYPNKILNLKIKKQVLNTTKSSAHLKNNNYNLVQSLNSFINKIQFDTILTNNSAEDYIIVTYQYEVMNFFNSTHEKKTFCLDFDKLENSKQAYKLEIKMDVTFNSLFGNDVAAQLIYDNEENLKWKSQKDNKEIHFFIQYNRKNYQEIKGSFIVSNFDRNDKFSYSHSHKNNWDFKDWFHHHGHSTKNYGMDAGGANIIIEMGFAFILLFGIFGCIFFPIVCINDEDNSKSIENGKPSENSN